MFNELQKLYGPGGWRERRGFNVFRSDEGLRWFVRLRREELLRRGALFNVAGRLLVHPQRLEQALLDIGAERAGVDC